MDVWMHEWMNEWMDGWMAPKARAPVPIPRDRIFDRPFPKTNLPFLASLMRVSFGVICRVSRKPTGPKLLATPKLFLRVLFFCFSAVWMVFFDGASSSPPKLQSC